jgi:hypothetical protein
VVEVSVSLPSVIVDCRDPRRQAERWAQVLAYRVSQRNPDEFRMSDLAGLFLSCRSSPRPAHMKSGRADD